MDSAELVSCFPSLLSSFCYSSHAQSVFGEMTNQQSFQKQLKKKWKLKGGGKKTHFSLSSTFPKKNLLTLEGQKISPSTTSLLLLLIPPPPLSSPLPPFPSPPPCLKDIVQETGLLDPMMQQEGISRNQRIWQTFIARCSYATSKKKRLVVMKS